MYSDTLLVKLVREHDPVPALVDYLISRLSLLMDLDDVVSSYDKVEEWLQGFEKWLHDAWGSDLYRNLAIEEHGWALQKALQRAAEIDANVLVCDGFSIRELLALQNKLGDRLHYTVERTPAPTTTQNVSMKIFHTPSLKDAFTGEKLYEGRTWRGDVIADIMNPPRVGSSRGHLLLTQYPDAPLTGARAHRTTQVQDVSRVVGPLIDLVESLSRNAPLVVTGDHGYIYLGSNPAKYFWGSSPRRQERYGGEYGDNGLEVDGISVAVGRIHVNVSPGSNTFIAHGGVSLTESLVPVVTVGA
ncbi:MAG: hypothetical protein ABIJ47_06040 [Candidatus Bathyarchaeota archaeon]